MVAGAGFALACLVADRFYRRNAPRQDSVIAENATLWRFLFALVQIPPFGHEKSPQQIADFYMVAGADLVLLLAKDPVIA